MVFSAACICFSPFLCPEFQLLQPLWCPLLLSPEGTFQLHHPSVLTLGITVLSAAPGLWPFPACPTRTHLRGPHHRPAPGEDVPELLLPLPTASFPPLPGSHCAHCSVHGILSVCSSLALDEDTLSSSFCPQDWQRVCAGLAPIPVCEMNN